MCVNLVSVVVVVGCPTAGRNRRSTCVGAGGRTKKMGQFGVQNYWRLVTLHVLRHINSYTAMRLAMTSKTTYETVLHLLREDVWRCFKMPYANQKIYYMPCPHQCDDYNGNARHTACVVRACRSPKYTVVCCTNCMHSWLIRTVHMPNGTTYGMPLHEVMVGELKEKVGARHSLFQRLCADERRADL